MAQRASQGDPIRGHRHECRQHQWSEREPRERSGGVRQIPCNPECGGRVRPGPKAQEPDRRWDAVTDGADSVDVAQEWGELDWEEKPKVGVDRPRMVRNGHGLRDEVRAPGHQ